MFIYIYIYGYVYYVSNTYLCGYKKIIINYLKV